MFVNVIVKLLALTVIMTAGNPTTNSNKVILFQKLKVFYTSRMSPIILTASFVGKAFAHANLLK